MNSDGGCQRYAVDAARSSALVFARARHYCCPQSQFAVIHARLYSRPTHHSPHCSLCGLAACRRAGNHLELHCRPQCRRLTQGLRRRGVQTHRELINSIDAKTMMGPRWAPPCPVGRRAGACRFERTMRRRSKKSEMPAATRTGLRLGFDLTTSR